MNKNCLLIFFLIPLLCSCSLLDPDEDNKADSEAVPVGRVVLNFFYNDVEWVFTYNDSSKIIGQGGHTGNFDSNYGTAESKTENGVKVITGTIDRVMPFGETVKADLKLTFNDDASIIKKIEFEKTSEKNDSEKWVFQAEDILFFEEDDTKQVYEITDADVCSKTVKNYYKLITGSYYKTISDWNRCLTGDISHITVEIYK